MSISTPSVGDSLSAGWGDDVANALNNLVLGDNTDPGGVTIGAVGAITNAGAKATVTLAKTTRVEAHVHCMFNLASGSSGRYTCRPYFNSGTSGSWSAGSTSMGFVDAVCITVPGVSGASSCDTAFDVLLPAGTYTFFPGISRDAGGSSSDTYGNNFVRVKFAGYS